DQQRHPQQPARGRCRGTDRLRGVAGGRWAAPSSSRPRSRHMRAAVIHLLTTVLLLPLLLAPPPAAASGADPLIEYSADGQAWSQQPPALFPGARLIPGGTATSTLWIRHRAPLPAQVSLTAGDAAGN